MTVEELICSTGHLSPAVRALSQIHSSLHAPLIAFRMPLLISPLHSSYLFSPCPQNHKQPGKLVRALRRSGASQTFTGLQRYKEVSFPAAP